MTNLNQAMAHLATAYLEKEELANKIAASVSEYKDAVGKIAAAKRMKEEDGCVIANGGRNAFNKIKNPAEVERCQVQQTKILATYTGIRDKAKKDKELGEAALIQLNNRIAMLEAETERERETDRTNRTTLTDSTAQEQTILANLGVSLTNSLAQTDGDNAAKSKVADAESAAMQLKAASEAEAAAEALALETEAKIKRDEQKQKTNKLIMILLAVAVVAVGGFVAYKKFA